MGYWKNIKMLHNKSFYKDVIILLRGSVGSQILNFILLPVLARVYVPEAFGKVAVVLASATILNFLLAGRYELAIILPRSVSTSKLVVCLCLVIASFTSGFLMLLTLVIDVSKLQIFSFIGNMKIIVLYAYLVTLNIVFYYWNNFNKKFSLMSNMRIYVTILFNAMAFLFYRAGESGLISAYILSQLIVDCIYGYFLYKDLKTIHITPRRLLCVAKRYDDFPKYSLLGDTLAMCSQQLPVYLLTFFFGANEVGLFTMGQRCVNAPVNLIIQSIGDVFRQSAAEAYAKTGNCVHIYKKTFKMLIIIAFIISISLLLLGPWIFPLFLGAKWVGVSKFIIALIPMYFFRCISNPLGNIVLIAEKQKAGLQVQVVLFITLFSTIYILATSYENCLITVFGYGLIYSLLYVTWILLSYKWAKPIMKSK